MKMKLLNLKGHLFLADDDCNIHAVNINFPDGEDGCPIKDNSYCYPEYRVFKTLSATSAKDFSKEQEQFLVNNFTVDIMEVERFLYYGTGVVTFIERNSKSERYIKAFKTFMDHANTINTIDAD